ncbi:ABC transporter permease [Bradyrhizobium yuanmingense]|uniref:Amino acid/amide ABC transporter membrane protein 1, HAAT family /amino acid/amide ABC transporter membrane protein 2, HAAT family n=1 Tax=Bradyrhizobium yuanmingense TaxID=108015 RepID=A0A1C3UDH5_9BRAD|nr:MULTISPECIES: ABC transporter permease [Bradyrhizobium]TWI20818.1 amino acid/amide ABC transporter membrane protein 1 (HAAT family) /amino acid/amide ABC transporter membrane protein 2 (HAAT family) [Bradyrhizobium yuanmingense]UWU86183.1 ABC transporter permease [Bradyrhizobium sp. CB1024]SCB13465.1 amino acid/amide ABC transporter membrane protein 1, HAAT family /amino acid/amide ABC transporter membrane protein 2, HAAT family [Bradyrhizobium yuanmingense]
MSSWLDHTINGLIVGNVYALVAVGLALIFGVSRLINFAQGSIYLVGAYIGWIAVVQLHTPLPLTIIVVAVAAAIVGLIIERFGLRPLQNSVRIAPLLATIGISFVLDQLVMLIFSPNPRALPSQLPDVRFQVGGGTIGPLDLLIAGVGLTSALLLFVFLRYTKLGWAVRATAQDRDAAMQMGVDVNRVNQAVFGIAAALGGVSGMLVGMYYNQIDTAMSLQATLKGVVAEVVGGAGNVPGAVIGSLLLGLVESYGVAVLGTSYRNLFAFLLLVVVLVVRPNGLFVSARQAPPEPLTGTFIAPSRPVNIPRWALLVAVAGFAILPLFPVSFYVLQTLINAWLLGMLGLSLTLVAGTMGQVSLGHAALLAIGAYTSALLSLVLAVPAGLAVIGGGLMSAALGTLLISPSFRLRGHYVSIATLAIGEIVALVILNWESVTRGPIGISGIPPLALFGYDLISPTSVYWFSLAVMVVLALLQGRLLTSHLGRSFRAIRDDDIAARAYGLSLNRYKSIAFIFGGFAAGVSGGIAAHLYSYINHETFNTQQSILALTVVILGGLGNVVGAIVGSVALVGLPEVFRIAAEYRILIYGIVLLLLVRFRPQGLLGTV